MIPKISRKINDFISQGIFRHVAIMYQQENKIKIKLDLCKNNPTSTSTAMVESSDKSPSSIFLVASLTKPVVAMAVLKLVEEGIVNLNQRMSDFFPQLKADGKIQITLRHLLTHTSGLPDLPPDNVEMRHQLAPLEMFFERACTLPLDFSPGKNSRYSSLGFMLLAQLLEKLTGSSLPDFLKEYFFNPLGMTQTSLGLPRKPELRQQFLNHLVPVEMNSQEIEKYGNWNSDYWRNLGAPWGGMFSTIDDLSRFCRMIYESGMSSQGQLLSPRTIHAACMNQLDLFPEIPTEARCRPWGLGWRLNWINHRQTFGELLPNHVVGHYGATGNLMWIDLQKKESLVLLTSTPHERATLEMVTLSNMAH